MLGKVYREEEKVKDQRVARICAVFASYIQGKLHKTEDFIPREVKTKEQPKKQTKEEMIAMVRLWNASVGGKESI